MTRRSLVTILAPLLALGAACSIAPPANRPLVEVEAPAAQEDAAAAAQPLRVLLVTGGCCHDYDAQKEIIPEGVSERANVAWTIVHEGGTGRDHELSVFANDEWTERYDVVVHNTCFGGLKNEAFVEGIVEGHRKSGVGAVILHCGLHSYRNLESKRWHEFLGVSSMRHDPGGSVPVENARPSHPIMVGFPDAWTTPKDELYVVERTWPGMTILGVAWSATTKMHSPIIWTNTSGEARIFGASIGHSNETMSNPAYLAMVARGILWTAKQLDESGEPLPGYGPTAKQRASE